MFKVLAGNLSAIFNLDGKHLDRYLQNKEMIKNSICEELILHDQIFIPTQDYLTACGLILVLGESNFISLLEDKRIHFLRLRGTFGYMKGTGLDGGLISTLDPDLKRPQDSSIEDSIKAGLTVISNQITEKKSYRTSFPRIYPFGSVRNFSCYHKRYIQPFAYSRRTITTVGKIISEMNRRD